MTSTELKQLKYRSSLQALHHVSQIESKCDASVRTESHNNTQLYQWSTEGQLTLSALMDYSYIYFSIHLNERNQWVYCTQMKWTNSIDVPSNIIWDLIGINFNLTMIPGIGM